MSRNTMTDQHLGESLRRLPEARARDGFTAAVLARVDRLAAGEGGRVPSPAPMPAPAPARWRGGWPLAGALTAAASVAAVTVAVLLALGAADPRPRDGAVLQAATREAGEGMVPAGSGGARGAAVNPSAGEGMAGGQEEIVSPSRTNGAAMSDRADDGGPDNGGAKGGGANDGGANGGGAADGRAAASAAAGASGHGTEEAAVAGENPAPPHDSTPARASTAPPPFAPSSAESSYRLAAAGRPGAGTGDEAVERLARLRRERAELLAELTALRRAVPPQRPSELLLGGDESFELVLDLQAGGRSGREAPGGGYQPASLERPAPAPHRL